LKKIVIVVGSSVVGGAEKQSLLLAKQLSLNFHVELVFLGTPGPFIEVATKSGIKVWISRGTIFSDLVTIFLCLHKSKPTCQINFLYRADILGGLVGKILQVQTVINSARNTFWPNFNARKRLLLRIVSKTIPTYVVANSQAAMTWHISIGYPKSKFVVIPNILDIGMVPVKPGRKSNLRFPVRLGIASRAVIGKGHKTLIGAAKILEARGVKCEVWFKGYGVPDWELILKERQESEIVFNLQEGELELSQWFRDIDIYCGISENWESDSNSVNEAVLSQVPLIVSELISIADYSPPPPQVKSGVPDSIAEGILEILEFSFGELKGDLGARQENLIQSREIAGIAKMWTDLMQDPKLSGKCI